MLSRRAILFLALPAAVSAHAADAPLPAPLPPARYEPMMARSPFAPATPAATPVAAPGFAADWFVSGLAKLGDRDFVTIQSRDGQKRFSLLAGETGAEGITVTKIEWAADIAKSRVIVKKGGETAPLEFDQAAMQRAAAAIPQTAAAPGQPPRVLPGAMPLRAPIMPGPPQPAQAGQPGRGAPPEQRRRIRIINSPGQ